ncbi:hypothetical protein [Streptomyces aidingensis]|uniref:Poxvirus protein I5 n=1 Tax=Streptomyces aidingensis TaxID=910347 RepID=A0A1I1MN14_9ACTN|nr:hypothetical protein [Streptomyces aidingensis]SFC84578.1 hypothetical protein SAMN05421773_106253 [Streptomyces aidingensis]
MTSGNRNSPGRRRTPPRRGDGAPRPAFALFGETLLAGVAVLVLALPLVTLLPALAAGCAHLRRHLRGESEQLRAVWADFLAACRALWATALAVPAVAAALLWSMSVAEAGAVPGAAVLRPAALGLLAVGAVLLLRTAAAWSADAPGGTPPARPGDALRGAAEATRDDPAGSVLLFAALVMAGVLVWMLPVLLLITGGLLCLAAVAVDHRHRDDAGEDGAADTAAEGGHR